MIDHIQLTDEQLIELEPFFQAVRDANARGDVAGILAQIYTDGMFVKLFEGEKCHALSKALGANGDSSSSVAERIAKINTKEAP